MHYCPKCGKQLSDDVNFCPSCGEKVSAPQPQTIKLRCKDCNGIMTVSEDRTILACPYCGCKELLPESDSVTVERIRQKAYTEVELGKQQLARDRMKWEDAIAQERKDEAEIAQFKKGFWGKALIVFAFISGFLCAVSFSSGHIFPGLIAAAMVVLFVISWLMGMHIIKEEKKGLRFIATVLAFALIFPYFGLYNAGSFDSDDLEQIDWDSIYLSDVLPVPPKTVGKIVVNTRTSLSVWVNDISHEEYMSYIVACADAGFAIDVENSSTSYEAYNADGYNLRVLYLEFSEELTINVDEPRKVLPFEWPTNGAGSLLPKPPSLEGNVVQDSASSYRVYVANITKENYASYVRSCETAGFTVNYDKGEDSYKALNAAGYELTLRYVGFNTMEVYIKEPENLTVPTNTTDPTYEPTSPTTQPTEPSGSSIDFSLVSPEFKEAMDSYEEFFDEYVTFMNNYTSSDDPVSMMNDYTQYMQQYAKTMQELSEINSDELSAIDYAYYVEVQARISMKLLEIGNGSTSPTDPSETLSPTVPTTEPTEVPTVAPTAPTDAPVVHYHSYVVVGTYEPSCTQPGFTTYECTECGYQYNEEYGAALDHDIVDANCTEPSRCLRCGEVLGDNALGHDWLGATCTEPAVCFLCGAVGEPDPDQHNMSEATYSSPATCIYCGYTEGSALDGRSEEAVENAKWFVWHRRDLTPAEAVEILVYEDGYNWEDAWYCVNQIDNEFLTGSQPWPERVENYVESELDYYIEYTWCYTCAEVYGSHEICPICGSEGTQTSQWTFGYTKAEVISILRNEGFSDSDIYEGLRNFSEDKFYDESKYKKP